MEAGPDLGSFLPCLPCVMVLILFHSHCATLCVCVCVCVWVCVCVHVQRVGFSDLGASGGAWSQHWSEVR